MDSHIYDGFIVPCFMYGYVFPRYVYHTKTRQ
jgi:hypothetical protein